MSEIIQIEDRNRLVDMLMMLRCNIEETIRREEKWIREDISEDIKMWDQGARVMLEIVLKELDFILEDNGYK